MPANESATHAATPAEAPRNATEVFAVFGADPEVLAYAMAKYSRSSLSMKESLREISSQRAEQFLNTFYFQYGHRSIADLAHLALAVERLSLLAAIVLVDEQRWDGQERSTRYQDFMKSGWYLPDFGDATGARQLYCSTVEGLFHEYHATTGTIFHFLRERTPRPEGMKQEAFDRTVKARAFDVTRYLLPLATNTSLGQIVSARTLEGQISRLLSAPHAEVRDLGQKLKDAAAGAAWNVQSEAIAELQQRIAQIDPALAEEAAGLLGREVKTAPTLVKYAAPSEYLIQTRRELAEAAAALMKQEPVAAAPSVDLVERRERLEVELATTLLYGVCHYPYRQIRERVEALGDRQQQEIVEIGMRHRGSHDELLREFSAGQSLRFDILMDIGGFRDMHRHRKCTQILQPFTSAHGYELPETIIEAGLRRSYEAALDKAHAAHARLGQSDAPEAAHSAQYLLPLATRTRALFKMDFAEALYISELRTAPQGHFSYRRVAWEMYQAVAREHPSLAKYFRVTDVNEPVDLLKR